MCFTSADKGKYILFWVRFSVWLGLVRKSYIEKNIDPQKDS